MLRALASDTGAVRWSYAIGQTTYFSAPAVGNGRVFVTTMTTSSDNNPIISVDALTGEFTPPRAIFSSQWSNFLQPTPYKDGLYMSAGYYGSVVYGFDYTQRSGWGAETKGYIWDGETPAVDEDTVYYYSGKALELIDRRTGDITASLADPFFENSFYSYYGAPILGTPVDSIDLAEDRDRFSKLLKKLKLRQPENGIAHSGSEAKKIAKKIGFPVVIRPSYVLGGRAMEIVHAEEDLVRYMREAVKVSNDSPVLIDRFLNDAAEVDVDAVSDGKVVVIGGIMEHIEQAGVHSGDSACSLPPYSLSQATVDELKRQTAAMAKALNVVGLMNVQFAIQQRDGQDIVYVLEVNPRASRTVPYVSKATGISLAKVAARCMAGQSLDSQGVETEVVPAYYSVKEAVFPFNKFPGVDPVLGPEMRSTGEVMGVGKTFGEALFKSQLAAGSRLPEKGTVLMTVKDSDKPAAVEVARALHTLGYPIVATRGTASAIEAAGIPVRVINKVKEGRPHIVDMIKNSEIALVFTTVDETRTAIADSRSIRQAALAQRVTYYTTIAGARAAVEGLKHMQHLDVYDLQGLHATL